MTTTKFLYDVEGDRCVGTLADYAKALEHAAYSGFEVGPLFDLHCQPIHVARHGYTTDDDYMVTTLTVDLGVDGVHQPGEVIEEATVRIDGRA